MNKKFLAILFAAFSASTICAMAHSTIYVDEIGRLHFLGKDPGSKANYVQQMGNFDNPTQKDVTNIIYKNSGTTQTPANSEASNSDKVIETTEQKYNSQKSNNVSKSKGSCTYNKGSMDASSPYTFGNTNIEKGVNESKTIYTDDLGRKHFFGKDNIKND